MSGLPIDQFCAEARRISRRVKEVHVQDVRALTIEGLKYINENAPLDTGQYRASSRAGINAADESIAERPGKGEPQLPPLTQSDFDGMLAGLKLGDSPICSNNVGHAIFLEEGTVNMEPRATYMLASIVVSRLADKFAATFGRRVEAR